MSYYDEIQNLYEKEGWILEKYEFISNYIFDFTTYDREVDKIMVDETMEVVEAIANRETHEYIEVSKENYLKYISVVNYKFFEDKLDWGMSIRGAWFERCEEFNIWGIEIDDLQAFMIDLLKWWKE